MEQAIRPENMPTSSNPEFDPNVCRICGGESLCENLGVIRYEVPVGDPRFGKLFRCPYNPVDRDVDRQERIRRLSNLDTYKDKTFDNFEPNQPGLKPYESDSLHRALNTAEQYAETPGGWLLLEGGYGCGKTHLAAAVGNMRLQRGDIVLFITVPDLLDHLRSTYGPTAEVAYDDSFERIRNAQFLILDDLGSESPSPWAQEKLFQLLNHRYNRHLPTVVTTNHDLDRFDPRIRSRLLDVELVHYAKITAPDHRTFRPNQNDNLSSLPLYTAYTFESFDIRSKLTQEERARLGRVVEAAKSYAQNPVGWLVLLGPNGSGKTHLAAAIAQRQQEIGNEVTFLTVPDLLDYLRVTFNPSAPVTFDQRFQMIRNAPLLVLDHFDIEGSSWAKEKLFQILDYRYVTRRPTVITTAENLESFDSRFAVRMLDGRRCSVFLLDVPDYPSRLKRK
jgi:DNA replication protein DnaC